jgi:Zn finger protein HypA/HybF involved in hydrogenase expression
VWKVRPEQHAVDTDQLDKILDVVLEVGRNSKVLAQHLTWKFRQWSTNLLSRGAELDRPIQVLEQRSNPCGPQLDRQDLHFWKSPEKVVKGQRGHGVTHGDFKQTVLTWATSR